MVRSFGGTRSILIQLLGERKGVSLSLGGEGKRVRGKKGKRKIEKSPSPWSSPQRGEERGNFLFPLGRD